MKSEILTAMAMLGVGCSVAWCHFKPVEPRKTLGPDEIAVTRPGIYAERGKTYVLMSDIVSDRSALFLGEDVTLDLNGYTVRYADGGYQHVPNYSFEDGLKGWNISAAPGVKVADQRWLHPLDGNNVCRLPEGQEIASPCIELPVADRAYFAMALVASEKSVVQVRVQDENGRDVQVQYKLGSSMREGVPVTGSPRMGGGGVIGLFSGQPAGKYRILVKAVKGDAVIDCVDIRPAMDTGIGIVGKIRPFAYHKALYDGELPSFYDYSADPLALSNKPRPNLPVVTGGKVTIRNGTIRSGFEGAQSTGILCSSADTTLIVENVKFEAAGINTHAIRTDGDAQVRDCRFEIDTPFIINRHVHDMPVVIHGNRPSEVTRCEFIGGQGNLSIAGEGSVVSHNLFVNAQTVTNHYSVMVDASGVKIHDNQFRPKIGSALYIYRNQYCEVFNNTFEITAAPPNNEYATTDYSTNAIRISDYNEKEGSPKGCYGNRIYRNHIKITGVPYPQASKSYMAMAYGIFMSVGGGKNEVFDNEIVVDNRHPTPSTGEAYAFYIGGSNNGGVFHGNKVTANTPFFWIANRYGVGANVEVYNNTLIKSDKGGTFPAVRMGWNQHSASNVRFFSNRVQGMPFNIEVVDRNKASSYDIGWTLTVRTQPGIEVRVTTPDSTEVAAGRADSSGVCTLRVPVRSVRAGQTTENESITITVGTQTKTIKLTSDTEVELR